jgi:hypothetical protein
LRSLFCGRNTTLPSIFLAGIARPPLLMTGFLGTPQAVQSDFRQAINAHGHD